MKVAICGAGDMGGVHFDAFSKLRGVSVVGICDPDSSAAGRFAGRGARLFAKSEDMIDAGLADVISIAAPTQVHTPLAIRALAKGLHVFCEKPMARTVADGEAMVKAAARAKRTLAIGYVLRFDDAYRLARDYVRGGQLGAIGTVRTSRCGRSETAWLRDVEANGGAVFELLTHDLDWLQWSLGPAKRVFARGLAKGKKTVERDYCLAVLRFGDGTVAHLEGSLAEAGDFYAAYEIAGSDGLLSYDTRKSAVLEARLIAPGGLRTVCESPQSESPFARQVRAFVEAVWSGKEYEVCAEAAMPALRLASAVCESIESGGPVDL